MDKRQLQTMLREMRVSFPPEATEAELAELLKQENRRQWMKASALREVRTKKKSAPKQAAPPPADSKPVSRLPKTAPVARKGAKPDSRKLTHRGMIQKRPAAPIAPAPGAPKGSDPSTPPESVGACDLCAKPTRESGEKLTAYSLADQAALRNTVFLCPGCIAAVKTQNDARDIRVLKRKARRRADARLHVSYGKVKHTWGYKP
jgi:hypothetical protein